MTRILVTGANGQLGNELRVLSAIYKHIDFTFTDIAELDICNYAAIEAFLIAEKFDFLINSAAYTAVDKAESDTVTARLVNCTAPGYLSELCKKHAVRYIHVSTDYVFDGMSYIPYTETMPVNPVSAYGVTKLDGETITVQNNPESIIIRTSWLYSSFGNNFVKTMIRLGKERSELNVVFDQVGTPTYARDLADAIISITIKTVESDSNWVAGIYHYSNEGVCSWYDFAVKIQEIIQSSCKVFPIESREYPTPAKRPHYSVFNKNKIKNTFSIKIPHWENSLKECITVIG